MNEDTLYQLSARGAGNGGGETMSERPERGIIHSLDGTREGRIDFKAGRRRADCPYKSSSPLYVGWFAGWDAAKREARVLEILAQPSIETPKPLG